MKCTPSCALIAAHTLLTRCVVDVTKLTDKELEDILAATQLAVAKQKSR